jgi:hypothetical protein
MRASDLLIVVIGAVIAGGLACSQSKQGIVDKPQEPKRSEMQQIVSSVPTASEIFYLRSECAKLGEKILAEHSSHISNFTDSEVSHYNPLTNRCYVETISQWADLSDKTSIHKYLWDGQTGEILATFRQDGICRMEGLNSFGNSCKRSGDMFSEGQAMRQADKTLGTNNESIKDEASYAEEFINNVMADDRKR